MTKAGGAMHLNFPPEVIRVIQSIRTRLVNAGRGIAAAVRKAASAIARWLSLILDDLLLLVGVVLVTRGVSFIYPPAGYIVLGLCLWGLAYLVARRRAVGGRRG